MDALSTCMSLQHIHAVSTLSCQKRVLDRVALYDFCFVFYVLFCFVCRLQGQMADLRDQGDKWNRDT